MINTVIILIAFVVNVIFYIYFSKKVKNYINVCTPLFIINTGTLFLPEIGNTVSNTNLGSAYGYSIIYGTYTLTWIGFITGYLITRNDIYYNILNVRYDGNIVLTLLMLILSYIIYSPIIIEFSDYLLSPRAIYEKTRVGYGINYFISTTFGFISLILALFERNKSFKIIVVISVIILAYIHGSKGQLLEIFFILIMYIYVVNDKKVNIKNFLYFSIITLFFGLMLFYLTISTIEVDKIIDFMIGYSDYSRNAVMLIDANTDHYWGSILFEDNLYSRIPRAIYENKPSDYGSFMLAKKYFPDEFYRAQGIPSFGIGIFFSDFGNLAIPILVFFNFISGVFTKIILNGLLKNRNPYGFILLLYFIGIGIISIGFGILLPEHLALAIALYFIGKLTSFKIII